MPTETPEDESVRVWMVERTYAQDEHNVVVTYATPDGERFVREHRNRRVLLDPVTVTLDVAPDRLEAAEETERRTRYADEAARMADRRDLDDEV